MKIFMIFHFPLCFKSVFATFCNKNSENSSINNQKIGFWCQIFCEIWNYKKNVVFFITKKLLCSFLMSFLHCYFYWLAGMDIVVTFKKLYPHCEWEREHFLILKTTLLIPYWSLRKFSQLFFPLALPLCAAACCCSFYY